MGPVPKLRTAIQVSDSADAGVEATNITAFDKPGRYVRTLALSCISPVPYASGEWFCQRDGSDAYTAAFWLKAHDKYLTRTLSRPKGPDPDPSCYPQVAVPAFSATFSQNASTLVPSITGGSSLPTLYDSGMNPISVSVAYNIWVDTTHGGELYSYMASPKNFDAEGFPIDSTWWPTIGEFSTSFYEDWKTDCLNNHIGSTVTEAVDSGTRFNYPMNLQTMNDALGNIDMAAIWANPGQTTVYPNYAWNRYDPSGLYGPWYDSGGNIIPINGNIVPIINAGAYATPSAETPFTSGSVATRSFKTYTASAEPPLKVFRVQAEFSQLTNVLVVEGGLGYMNGSATNKERIVKLWKLVNTVVLDAGNFFEIPAPSVTFPAIYQGPSGVGPVAILNFDVQLVVGFQTIEDYVASLNLPGYPATNFVVSSWHS